MKRDKLYTINKGNKNLFAYAGSLNSIAAADKSNNPWDYADDLSTTAQFLGTSRGQAYANTKNALGITKAQNPFSQMNIGGTLTAAAPIVGGAVGGLLSGGMSTGVGNIMGGLGKAASAIPGPYGAAISAGLQIAGGAINGLFGEKVDQEKLAKNNAGTSYLNNFSSNAATFDAVQGPQTQLAVQNAYKGGIFNKSAKRKNVAARTDRLAAQRNASAQVENNIGNLVDSQMDNMLANYSAFGGALDIMQNDKYIDAINNRSNVLAKALSLTPSLATSNPNTFDVGGNLKMAFLDDFSKDPMGAVMNYNRGLEQMAADREARKNAAAQEELINGLQTGLQKAQTENEGLLAMYNSQQQALNALQNMNAGLPATGNTAPYPITSEDGGDDLISGIANSGAKVVRDVMTGNNRGADDYSNLKEFIKKHESFVPKAYQLKGEPRPTIGYGFFDVYPGTNRKIQAGDTITEGEADKYLSTALRNLDKVLAPKVPNWNKLTNNQRDAIRDLAYSTGPWAAHFKPNSRLFNALRNEDWAAAEKELTSRSKSLDAYNKGLGKRNKRRQAMWRSGDYSVKAFGGELGTNVTDWTNGLLQINAGGSHEDNPLEGVPLGVDQNGVPNLVEEGETVFNDYVFSKRLTVPKEMLKDLGLSEIKSRSKKRDLNFADASKKIAQESEQRPNDPISKAGLETGLAKLAQVQEAERMRIQAEQEVEEAEAASMQGEPVVAACGGKLSKKYPDGGYLWDDFWKVTNPTSKLQGRPDNKYKIDTSYKGNVRDREREQDYIDFTNYILDGATPEERLNYFKWIDANTGRKAGKYIDANGNLVSDWRNMYTNARNDGLWGIQHYVPQRAQSAVPVTPKTPTPVAETTGVGPLANAAPYERQSGISYYGPGEGNKSYYEAAMETGFGGQDTNWEGSTAPIFVPAERDEAALNTQVPYRIQDEATTTPQQSKPADRRRVVEEQSKPYPTWMRYAPIVGTGIATMTDLLGLTNKPDYSYADKIEALAERAGYAPNIRAPYIGDYMRYTPFDRLFYANQLQANSRATDRGLMNTSGGNRGAAQAGMLANGYNSQLGLGNLYRQAEEYNRGQYERTKAFNRGTNQFNAQMGLEADMANARYRQMASQYQMQGLGQAAAMRQAEKARTDAARSLNITNFLNNLGNLGRENFAMNQINSDRAFGYGTRSNGNSYWKRDTRDTAAFGGELDKRNKKSNKRRRG